MSDFQNKLINCMIRKAVGGIYFVEAPDGLIFECKARGIFRKREISPCAGDIVTIESDSGWVISEIEERRNSLIRPPLANLDQLIFVISTCEPVPNFTVLDKFIAIAEYKGIEPVIAVTKVDLEKNSDILDVYRLSGIPIIVMDYDNPDSLAEMRRILTGKLSAFTGNSGVGKSTLLNRLDVGLYLETNEISKKLGRGKHTTRQVELYKLPDGGYIADTPGFSSLETNRYDIIRKDDLADCFREFRGYAGKCKFQDCSHTKEKGCAVLEAVSAGEIAVSRHNSYVAMYEEAKQIKEWEL